MSSDLEQITFFAKTDARGQSVPFGIKAKDRTRHVYVIGKTGMGKSTLLENMAIQDIKHGNGLAFIDPHGQTAETLLEYVPESRKDDVLYFAPFDTDNPVSFNVMEDVGPDKRHLVVSGLMSVFKKIWVDAWSARMEYILSNTLLALLEYPDSTLLGVNRMLSDKSYRKKVVDNIKDPSVRSFWVDEFANYNERYMQEAGDAIKNKIGQFTSNPLIRNIVGQPKSSFDIREMMDKKKIIIMNLSKGLVGESNANLLGSMLTTRIYLAAMSRADLSPEQMKHTPNFYFYVDEFQSFANATFANILSEARKYKLNLTIAHQYIEQMEEEVRNAVFGNVGTTIAFRVGPFDAEVLETIFTPKFLAPDIVNLGFAQVYLTLMIDGIGSQPFSAVTLPPIKPPEISCKDMVIHSSRQQFSHKRADVEASIMAWHAVTPSVGEKPKEQNVAKPELVKPRRPEVVGKEQSIQKPKPKVMEEKRPTIPIVPRTSSAQKTGNTVGQENGRQHKHVFDGAKAREPMQREKRIEPVSKEEGVIKSGHGEPHKNDKSLDDLRAILKKIAPPRELEPKQGAPVLEPVPTKSEPQTVEVKTSAVAIPAASGQGITQAESGVFSSRRNGSTVTSTVSHPSSGQAHEAFHNELVTEPIQAAAVQVTSSPLKEALAALVHDTGDVSRERVQPASPVVPSTPATSSPLPPPLEEKMQDFTQADTQTLSPKKLERMMRVTGSDKSPLL